MARNIDYTVVDRKILVHVIRVVVGRDWKDV